MLPLCSCATNAFTGVPFTSLAQILPFVLVGIGIDDMVSAICWIS
ncbi:unnamed protein product [Choristocarpus tenellus]